MVNKASVLLVSVCVSIATLAGVAAADGAQSSAGCDRDAFPRSYKQVDYMDTRARLLVLYADDGNYEIVSNARNEKLVVSGTWTDPYTGIQHRNVPAKTMHIDHVIPVCWAWYHGADTWSDKKRKQFYNDTRYLTVVEAGLNRSKGMQGPDRFMPMNRVFACDYILMFLDGVAQYGLKLSEQEAVDFRNARYDACAYEVLAR